MVFCKLINWYLIFDITLNCDLWSVTAMIHTEEVDTLPWESLTLFLRSLTLLLETLTLTNCHPSFVIAFNVLWLTENWNLKCFALLEQERHPDFNYMRSSKTTDAETSKLADNEQFALPFWEILWLNDYSLHKLLLY